MFGRMFKVKVKAKERQNFIAFIQGDIQFAEGHERGTVRFELYQDPKNRNSFFLYEAYKNKKTFAKHKKINPFYKRWKSDVMRGMMEYPQQDFFNSDAVCSLGIAPKTQQMARKAD